MAESAKRHEENMKIIKDIQASIDAAIRNQGASTKTLEIQIGQMSKVLHERGIRGLPGSTEPNPRDYVKSISTTKANSSEIRRVGCSLYVVSGSQHRSIISETVPFPRRLQNYCSLVDLGASVSVIPFSTYTNLGLGILSHTRLTIELADRTIKQPRDIAKNVLVRIRKFIFPKDFIILDIPEHDDVPLILGRPFLSTAHSKIDVYKRKITLGGEEEKLVFKSIKPATSIIRRVFMLKDLDSKTKLIGENNESFNPLYDNYIELNDLDTPLEPKTNQGVNFEPTFVNEPDNVKISFKCYYKMNFSCLIGYKNVNADYLPSFSINLITKSFYYSIIMDKDDHERKSPAETLIDIPIFVGNFPSLTGFIIIDDDHVTRDVANDYEEIRSWG
ncbi:ribonuclease H-like domain-containing protein [Tanacetum coccineum]